VCRLRWICYVHVNLVFLQTAQICSKSRRVDPRTPLNGRIQGHGTIK
jgi:hypothetical protein